MSLTSSRIDRQWFQSPAHALFKSKFFDPRIFGPRQVSYGDFGSGAPPPKGGAAGGVDSNGCVVCFFKRFSVFWPVAVRTVAQRASRRPGHQNYAAGATQLGTGPLFGSGKAHHWTRHCESPESTHGPTFRKPKRFFFLTRTRCRTADSYSVLR